MTVRDGRPDDLPALRAIQEATLAEPWPELLAVAADGPPLLLVAAEPDPTGYALAVRGDAETGADSQDAHGSDGVRTRERTDTEGRSAYLVELAVGPAGQGEGIGSALLSALVARLEPTHDRLWVTARETDDRVRDFYRERGFEERERLPDRYESGDGVLLVRELE